MKTRTGKILLHVLGSLCFLLWPVIFSPDFDLSFRFVAVGGFRRDVFSYILLLGFFYAAYYYFIPKFFHTKKYVVFGIITILGFGVISGVPLLVHGKPPIHLEGRRQPPPRGVRDGPPLAQAMERNLLRFTMVLAVALLVQINSRLRQAERDKLDAELSYLKAQINPHFLFNTLNSIYSLAIARSELTATAVVKLSEMMRYVTTEAHSGYVLLEKEINYVSNYIDLQRIRLGETVTISYAVTGTSGKKVIAPLILIPFVENAFKHGVSPEEESPIAIAIAITSDKLMMSVVNRIVKIDVKNEYRSGHGMDNVSQRLQMGYPGKHKLEVERDGNEFKVHLEVIL